MTHGCSEHQECTAFNLRWHCFSQCAPPPPRATPLCLSVSCCVSNKQVMNIKNVLRKSLAAYSSPTAVYVPGQRCWNADCKADVALPCATQVRHTRLWGGGGVCAAKPEAHGAAACVFVVFCVPAAVFAFTVHCIPWHS